MTQDDVSQSDLKNTITRAGYLFMVLWALGILFLYAAGGYLSVRQLLDYKAESEKIRQAWMESTTTEPRTPAPDMGTETTMEPVDVHVGISLDRISEIVVKEAGWTADFHIWFRWTGDTVNPGKNFQIANGRILEREQVIAHVRNGERYEQYRVTARMTKYFDTARVPLSDESLSLQVEDGLDGVERLRYVVDERSADIRQLAVPENVKITKTLATVKLHSYGSGRVDSGDSDSGDAVHSLFVMAMVAKGPSMSLYFRLFQALFASVAICMIVFFIKPIHVDPRFGLPVGAFFAAVGNNISVATLLPESGQVTLVQMIYAVSLMTIFLTLVQSAISLHILDSMGRDRFSRVFDKITFVVLGLAYVVLNLILPLVARS
jgi:hypothetical protein